MVFLEATNKGKLMSDFVQERLFPEEESDNQLELIRTTTTLGNGQKIVDYRFQNMVDTPNGRSCTSSVPFTVEDYARLKEYFTCPK